MEKSSGIRNEAALALKAMRDLNIKWRNNIKLIKFKEELKYKFQIQHEAIFAKILT